MINVIKHGKETFKAVCPICGCEFTYQAEDLKEDCFGNHYVECPDCKQVVSHEYEAKKKGLQKKIYVDDKDTIYSAYTTTPAIDWPDCDKCPNRPDPNNPVIGDSPCTWCKKMQPYCYAGDVFPKDYQGGKYTDKIKEE